MFTDPSTQPSYSAIAVTSGGGITHVTIDNPPLNLVDAALITDLRSLVASVREDPTIRVIVFQSADPEFFSAHGDAHFVDQPETFAALSEGLEGEHSNAMHALHESIRALPQVTIGKVAGFARGGGSELLMSMDMRFAEIGRAAFAQPETLVGIMPGGGGTQYLPRLTGRARALEIILGGGLIDARTAERYGLVNRALPPEEIDAFVDDLAGRIAGLDPAVLGAARDAVDAALTLPLTAGLHREDQLLQSLFTAEAAQRTVELLARGLQQRDTERDLESFLTKN